MRQCAVRMLLSLLLLLARPTQAGPPPLADLLTRAQQRLEASNRSGARRELREALRLLARADLAEADVQPILPTLAAHGRQDLTLRLLEALRARGLASGDS